MKLAGVISTAVLSLALGAAVPAYTQDREPQEDKAKPAQDEKKARNKKPRSRKKKTRSRRRTLSQKKKTHRLRTHSRRSTPVVDAFPTISTRPISDRATRFMSAKATTGIAASNTAAIRSDLLAYGPVTGCTRKTFL